VYPPAVYNHALLQAVRSSTAPAPAAEASHATVAAVDPGEKPAALQLSNAGSLAHASSLESWLPGQGEEGGESSQRSSMNRTSLSYWLRMERAGTGPGAAVGGAAEDSSAAAAASGASGGALRQSSSGIPPPIAEEAGGSSTPAASVAGPSSCGDECEDGEEAGAPPAQHQGAPADLLTFDEIEAHDKHHTATSSSTTSHPPAGRRPGVLPNRVTGVHFAPPAGGMVSMLGSLPEHVPADRPAPQPSDRGGGGGGGAEGFQTAVRQLLHSDTMRPPPSLF
jgi:hypothetical protein